METFIVCFVIGSILALLPHHFLCAVDLLAAIKQGSLKAILRAVLEWLGIALIIAFFIWICFFYS